MYGVKIGWFWTCFIVSPFIWFTSKAHKSDIQGMMMHLSRIVIATFMWYVCTNCFVTFERLTGYCHGATKSSRNKCVNEGGKWVPGFDISGHCFILIYSILIICEEDFELIITTLYFHHITHKMFGALVAIACWFVTYHAWYPALGVPPSPIHRRIRAS